MAVVTSVKWQRALWRVCTAVSRKAASNYKHRRFGGIITFETAPMYLVGRRHTQADRNLDMYRILWSPTPKIRQFKIDENITCMGGLVLFTAATYLRKILCDFWNLGP